MSRMAFSHEWIRKRLYDSFYIFFMKIAFSLHTDSWDDHFWHVLFIKKCCFVGKANTGHFIKNDLHEPCFLWNAFPELSVDMTCEANCTSAFYKQFPLKKSSNPCAMLAFECYFARILIRFLIYSGNSFTKLRWEKTGDGEGEKKRGKNHQSQWEFSEVIVPRIFGLRAFEQLGLSRRSSESSWKSSMWHWCGRGEEGRRGERREDPTGMTRRKRSF